MCFSSTMNLFIFSYERVTSLRAINPNLKVLLGINGWNTRFYPSNTLGMIAGPSFVQYTINFLRDREFDGIDVDWEYSMRRRGSPTSKDGFTELLRVMLLQYLGMHINTQVASPCGDIIKCKCNICNLRKLILKGAFRSS